jgi:sporulation protein YlmC with PRC-barrel domain
MPEQADVMEWRGCEVVDRDGDRVGKLDEIYIDRETGKPEWAIVNTGLFGRKSSFVPLKDAMREGDLIRVPYEKDHVKDAPSVEPDGEISADEEQRVYAHYGLEYSQARSGSGLPEGESAAGASAGGGVASGTATTAGGGTGMTSAGAAGTESGTPPRASAAEAGNGDSGAGLRLQRVIREDVRLGGEGDEVVERRTVQEERLRSDED